MSLRNRLPTILLLASLTLVAVVGIVLFRWLDRQMQVEVRQASIRLATAAGRIQQEIFLEFAVLTALFTYAVEDAEGGQSSPAAFHPLVPAHYQKWLEGTRFPGLIDTIVLVEVADGGQRLSHFVAANRRFSASTPKDADAISRTWPPDDGSGWYQIVADRTGLALVVPIQPRAGEEQDRGQRDAGRIALVLDRDYFATYLVPELFARYLGGRDSRFSFAVMAAGREAPLYATSALPAGRADRVVSLTTWPTPTPLLRTPPAAPPETASTLPPAVLSARLQDLLIRQWHGLAGDLHFRSGRFTSAASAPGIHLRIWHRAGSIAAAQRQERDRRLALGYAVLASFAVVAVVYYVLYRRARELRDREHQFVATVTHELRTPVSAVRAAAENLTAGIVGDPERVKQYGRAILDHGRRLGELIDQVLLYAGLAGPGASLSATRGDPLPIEPLIRRAVARGAPMPPERLTLTVEPDLPPYRGDALAVEAVVGNLLSNAAKHAGDQARVALSVTREQQRRPRLVLRVRDTGSGIPAGEIGKVTQPFHRGAASRQRHTPGTGLGLSLVERIVKTCGGTMSIDSAQGKGTTVTVRLPFAAGGAGEG